MRELIRNCYRHLLEFSTLVFGAKRMKCFDARVRFKRKIDLVQPQTLSDKVCYLELYENINNPLVVQCSDKYAVRDFIIHKGYKDILIPIIGVYEKLEEIKFEELPDRFALKATHGCEMNIICSDKLRMDWHKAKKEMHRWLNKPYYRACLEPHYLKIKPRIICEQYLDVPDGIIDYKIHCLNGKPIFILVCSEREKGLKLNVFDVEWQDIDAIQGHMKNIKNIERPFLLDKMLKISENLAQEFKFVRVDLYEIDGNIYFGELTFSPATGIMPYFTDDFIIKMGRLLEINV